MVRSSRVVRFAASLLMLLAMLASSMQAPPVATAAANMLTTNPSFEAASTNCIGHTTNDTSVSGWLLTLDSYNCIGISTGAISGKDGNNYAAIYGGGKVETAPAARAAVSAGTSYTLAALISKSRASATISSPARLRIVFYNGNTSAAAVVGQVDSGDLLAGAATSGFGSYSVSGAAPGGATYATAMFEFSRGRYPNQDTASFEVDAFSLSAASAVGVDAVTNGGFESGTSGWATVTGSGVATSAGRMVHSGSGALQVGVAASEVAQALALQPNTLYAFSAWGRTTAGFGEPAQITLQITDGASQTVNYRIKFTVPDWTRQARTIMTPATISAARVFVRKEAGGGSFAADDIALIAGQRDAQAWPHASDSIWNTPLGSGAQYASIPWAGLFGSYALDEATALQVNASAPLRDLYTRGSTSDADFGPCNRNTGWGSIGSAQGQAQVPNGALLNRWTRAPYSTPNDMSFIIQGDGRTVVQLQPTARCFVDGGLFGYRATDVDLYGKGLGGGHYGSGLSSDAGSIHLGELIGAAPIRHALEIEYHSDYVLSNTPPFRWPADRADYYTFHPSGSAAQDYYTYCSKAPCSSNPSAFAPVKMGALLALPANATIASLGLKTAPARKLFYALQNYGAYICDTSYRDQAFSGALGVGDEMQEHYGYGFDVGSSATGAAKDWYDDLAVMFQNLQVIDNNGPAAVGGGGTPRVSDPVPGFVRPPAAQMPLARSGWSASASLNTASASAMLDGSTASFWNSGQAQAVGQNIVLNLGAPQTFNRLAIDGTAQPANYPQNYAVYVTNTPGAWGTAVFNGSGFGSDVTLATFAQQTAQYVKIELTGGHINPGATWTVGDVNLYNLPNLPNANPAPALSAPTLAVPTTTAQNIALSWSAVSGAAGYVVKYGTRDGEYTAALDVGNLTSASFTSLTLYQRYYFVVYAYTSAGGIGSDSNERNAAPGGGVTTISFGRPASASLNNASAGNANDNNTATEWSAGGPTGFWQVDLGSPHTISQIAFNTGSVAAYASLRYKIEVANASDMTGATVVVDQLNATTVTGTPSYNVSASGQYVRITFVANPNNNYAVLAEFNVLGPNLNYTNLAAGKPASTDSQFASLPAAAANDEKTTTRWAATDTNAGHYLQIDLGATKTFDTLKLIFDFANATYKYTITASNASDMSGATTLVDRSGATTGSTPPVTHTVNATARYVRMTFASGSAYPSVREFEISGTP